MTMQTPPGWYPDPSGQPGSRWWDGAMWTEHVGPHRSPAMRPRLPQGTRTETAFIWVIALLPLISIAVGSLYSPTIRYTTIGPEHIRTVDPSSVYDAGYFLVQGVGLLLYAAGVVLARFDHRQLVARGVVRPFSWPWAFLAAPVYVIGRFVVLRKVAPDTRRTPMWVHIALLAAAIVINAIHGILSVANSIR